MVNTTAHVCTYVVFYFAVLFNKNARVLCTCSFTHVYFFTCSIFTRYDNNLYRVLIYLIWN